jgi:predicted DsbA family dithiol-disulfide isomerase
MGIQSLPTLLFIPVKGTPQAAVGALPKESLIKAINEVLLIK